MALFLKACPRCQGDLASEALTDGEELVCLQCSFRTTAAPGRRAAGRFLKVADKVDRPLAAEVVAGHGR